MKKRSLSIFLVLVLIMTFFSSYVFAATTYTDSLAFQGEHSGATRSYTGTHMYWSGYTYTQYQGDHMATTFTVTLRRDRAIGFDKIGTITLSRTGNHSTSWTNVGSGSYYFYYEKARDGANVLSDAITMKMI